MNSIQTNKMASLLNVQAFFKTNAAALASVITTGTNQDLDNAIVTLDGHANNQSQTRIEAQSTTQTQEALRTELIQFHMAPINRIAKLKLGDTPELAPFRMPKHSMPILQLKAVANGMGAAAVKYSTIFIAAGLPADFVAQLDAVSTAMVNASTSRQETAKRRQGLTSGLQAVISVGRRAVHALDPLVRRIIGKDERLLTNWDAAKRVTRTGSTTTPASATPVVATPATPSASASAATDHATSPST